MATTEERLSSLETKFELFLEEIRDFKTEMRDRDNQRAAEIMELRQKHDTDIKAMDSKFDKISEQIHTMTIAAVVGFGAIAAAIGGLIIAALK